jgi:hypothetical protein
MRRQARMTLSAKMEGEHNKTEYSDGIGLRLRLEGLSNVNYQSRTNYALGYDITYQDGNTVRGDVVNQEMVDVSYLEQSLYGQYGHQLSARHKLTADQTFLFGSGDINPRVTSFIGGNGGNSLSAGSQDFDDANGTVLRSGSTVSLESNLMARLSNRIKASLEWVDNPGGQFYQASLEQNLRYDGRRLRFRTRNFLGVGDNIEQVRLATRNNTKKTIEEEANYVFGSESNLTYRPNRNFDSELSLDFSFLDFDSGDAYETSIELRNQYAFFSKGGMSRLVGSLYNETEYTLTSRRDSGSSYALRFLLGGSYNPYRILKLGTEFEYQRYDFDGFRTYKLRTDAGLMFAKLQCYLSYSYALGQGGDYLSGDRKEHLIEAEVKKFF